MCQSRDPDERQARPPHGAHGAESVERDQHHNCQSRTPVLLERIGAKQNKAILVGDKRPAGAQLRASRQRRASAADHTACTNAQSINGGRLSSQIKNYRRGDCISASWKKAGAQPSQWRAPDAPAPDGCSSLPPARATAPVVPIHQSGNRQADRQINHHDDRDAFDGLAGLIDRRIRDGNQIGIADGHRERAVLSAVQILAGQRRHDERAAPAAR